MWQPLFGLARSFRLRLTLWFVAILALLFGGTGTYLYFSEAHSLIEAFNAHLETRIEELSASADHQTGLLAPSVAAGSGEYAPGESDELVVLLTPRGQIVQTFGGFPPQRLTPVINATVMSRGVLGSTRFVSLPVAVGSGTAVIYGYNSSVLRAGQHVYFLVVGLPSDVPKQQQQLLITLFVVLPIIVLLSALGGFWLANRAVRPIQAITRTVQQIGDSDLHRRLHVNQRDEVGELAATFDHMLDRLEQAFERQRQFTADASHELRTPLTIIDLEANRALTQPLAPAEYQQAMTLIQQENRAMARLVNDLLFLARADSGQTALRQEPVDLGEVVLEVVERLTTLAAQHGMTITVGALPDLVLQGDRQSLVRVVTNLVENALKHGFPPGDHVCIATGSESRNGQLWAWLRVSDNGPGIAAKHLPHLFERFYRIDQARTRFSESSDVQTPTPEGRAGNGLGLCITRWIVEAHGGQIHVQATEGQGTTFDVWLPIHQADASFEMGDQSSTVDADRGGPPSVVPESTIRFTTG